MRLDKISKHQEYYMSDVDALKCFFLLMTGSVQQHHLPRDPIPTAESDLELANHIRAGLRNGLRGWGCHLQPGEAEPSEAAINAVEGHRSNGRPNETQSKWDQSQVRPRRNAPKPSSIVDAHRRNSHLWSGAPISKSSCDQVSLYGYCSPGAMLDHFRCISSVWCWQKKCWNSDLECH